MCSLYFYPTLFKILYHTSGKNIQILGYLNFKIFSDLRYNEYMGILDNFENAWDGEFQFESKPIPVTDNMGRPTEDSSLAVKLFSETCCSDCSCK
jgi:hypothetical protein